MISDTLLGVILALGASASIAGIGSIGSRPLMGFKSNPANATYVALIVSTLILGVLVILTNEVGLLFRIPLPILLIFVVVGILQNGIGRKLWFISVRHIGANQSNTLVSTEVIYSVILAVVFLGESLQLILGVGTALVFAGAVLIEAKKSALKRSGNMALGYETALIAGFVFGATPILIKYGLNIFSYYIPVLFVSFAAAALFLTITGRPKTMIEELRMTPRSALFSFIAMGVLTASTQLCTFSSLKYAPVVFFAPMLSTYPLLTVVFTKIHAEKLEVFGARTLLSAAMVVLGATLVSLASV